MSASSRHVPLTEHQRDILLKHSPTTLSKYSKSDAEVRKAYRLARQHRGDRLKHYQTLKQDLIDAQKSKSGATVTEKKRLKSIKTPKTSKQNSDERDIKSKKSNSYETKVKLNRDSNKKDKKKATHPKENARKRPSSRKRYRHQSSPQIKKIETKYGKDANRNLPNLKWITPSKPNKQQPFEHDWFSKLFGFVEPSYNEVQKLLNIIPSKKLDGQIMVSKVNGASYNVGLFYTPTLSQLRTMISNVTRPGKLRITNEIGDIADKQADAENEWATFQVASQFNCLEFANPDRTPEDGVTNYRNDRTQGPACSISCGPATVFRNYFANMHNESSTDHYGQTRDFMIDNLASVSEMLGNHDGSMYTVKGGYTISSASQLTTLNKKIEELKKDNNTDELYAALRVGLHEDVQVTSKDWGNYILTDAHRITQVFGSACAVGYNRVNSSLWRPFATIILEASYEATICAALLASHRHAGKKGSHKIFLTTLGGGVFGNPIPWIASAIRTVCDKYKDYDLDIRIVTHSGQPHPALVNLAKTFR